MASKLATLAAARARISASPAQVMAPPQSPCTAIDDTSTNIRMVSIDAAVPNWRGHTQGRGCACLSARPPSMAASGAEPPSGAATAAQAAISARITMAVSRLVGRSTRSAPSRAGTISSFSSLGIVAGKGDATCST